jgi:hypothetical protein
VAFTELIFQTRTIWLVRITGFPAESDTYSPVRHVLVPVADGQTDHVRTATVVRGVLDNVVDGVYEM